MGALGAVWYALEVAYQLRCTLFSMVFSLFPPFLFDTDPATRVLEPTLSQRFEGLYMVNFAVNFNPSERVLGIS